jgi:hypothetical protein
VLGTGAVLSLGTLALFLPAALANDGGDGSGTTQSCALDYAGCVPVATDVDCAGGGGDGPAYVQGPVQVKVPGVDPYGLDEDNNGVGCDPVSADPGGGAAPAPVAQQAPSGQPVQGIGTSRAPGFTG